MRMNAEPSTTAASSDVVHILAGRIFDSYSLKLMENQHIKVNKASGLIIEISNFDDDLAGLDVGSPHVHDLRHLTVLPGFVDVHVHREEVELLALNLVLMVIQCFCTRIRRSAGTTS
jgi:cytosine/adenosine deaminase-related metal-dependent hydrolase